MIRPSHEQQFFARTKLAAFVLKVLVTVISFKAIGRFIPPPSRFLSALFGRHPIRLAFMQTDETILKFPRSKIS
jgi:hypothetical protein